MLTPAEITMEPKQSITSAKVLPTTAILSQSNEAAGMISDGLQGFNSGFKSTAPILCNVFFTRPAVLLFPLYCSVHFIHTADIFDLQGGEAYPEDKEAVEKWGKLNWSLKKKLRKETQKVILKFGREMSRAAEGPNEFL